MGKLVSLILVAAMAIHLIRPLGLPGLRRRADVWKIAFVAIFLFAFVVFIHPE